MSKSTETVFAADPEGFREINAGRPAAHLLRELVQNVFDEQATHLSVQLEFLGDCVEFVVIDDVPGGIRDERLIWTLWLSDKKDAPTKRGRMGRGLKELISVADETLIITESAPALLFERGPRGKWSRSSPKKHRAPRGTIISGQVRLWKKRDMDAAISYLRQMRPPEGLYFSVNRHLVERKAASEFYSLKLPTVIYEQEPDGRIERQRTAVTTVELFAEETPFVYEMGIPVEPIDFPLSIDVGQRIPLREKRDTMTDPYRRELFAKLVEARLPLMKPEQLRDNFVLTAAAAKEHLSEATKATITAAWTEGRPYASTPDAFRAATGQHIDVVNLRSLPESIRDLTRETNRDVRDVMAERQLTSGSRILSPLPHLAHLVRVWERIAAGIGRPCSVHLYSGQPTAQADFNRETKTLRLFVEVVDPVLLLKPLGADALSLLIHELAHWNPHEHGHGFDFHSDAEEVGGAVAAWLFENRREVEAML